MVLENGHISGYLKLLKPNAFPPAAFIEAHIVLISRLLTGRDENGANE